MKRRLGYRPYPTPESLRTGCKVGWRIYGSEVDAQTCAEAARHNAVIQESLGFDFGYCSPGSITKLDDGRYEVCVP